MQPEFTSDGLWDTMLGSRMERDRLVCVAPYLTERAAGSADFWEATVDVSGALEPIKAQDLPMVFSTRCWIIFNTKKRELGTHVIKRSTKAVGRHGRMRDDMRISDFILDNS